MQSHASPNPPPHRRRISWRAAYKLRRRLRKQEKLTTNDRFVFDELRPGDMAIDCGANVGEVTGLLAERGAVVHAFEPDPLAFEQLSNRFAENELVHCHPAAVSNAPARMRLYFRNERDEDPLLFSVGSTLDASKTDVDSQSFAEVDVVRLTDLIQELPHIRLLKIDIEGAEADVLEDILARDLFDRIDLTLVETHEEWIPSLAPRLESLREELLKRNITGVYFNWT